LNILDDESKILELKEPSAEYKNKSIQ